MKITSFKQFLDCLSSFCTQYGRLPMRSLDPYERRLYSYLNRYESYPEVIELSKAYKSDSNPPKKATKVKSKSESPKKITKIKSEPKSPRKVTKVSLEPKSPKKVTKVKSKSESPKKVTKIKSESNSPKRVRNMNKVTFEELKLYCISNNRIPLQKDYYGRRLYKHMRRELSKNNIKYIELVTPYYKHRGLGFPNNRFDLTIDDVRKWIIDNRRLPVHSDDTYECSVRNVYEYHISEFKDLSKLYSKINPATYDECVNFCKSNNRLPNSNNSKEEHRLRDYLNKRLFHPEVSELISQYGSKISSRYPKDYRSDVMLVMSILKDKVNRAVLHKDTVYIEVKDNQSTRLELELPSRFMYVIQDKIQIPKPYSTSNVKFLIE